MRRLLAAALALAAVSAPAAALAQHGEAVTTIGENANFQKGQYTAFNAPYCLTSSPCSAYVRGVDYADQTDARPGSFPARSTIRWFWPNGRTTIAGYMELIFGNYDNTIPKTPVAPVQLANLQAFTETFDVSTLGSTANFNILSEFYLTTQAGVASTKYEEVGFGYSWSDVGLFYFNGSTDAGTCVESGRTWSVKWRLDGSAHIYIMLYAGGPLLSGAVDRKAVLTCLVGKGLVDPTHWINGSALGVEVVRGSGAMTANAWSITLQ